MKPRVPRRVLSIACAAMWLLIPAVSLFGQGAPPPQPTPSRSAKNNYLKAEFELLDGNKDRSVSLAEFKDNAAKALTRAKSIAKMHNYQEHMVSRLYTTNNDATKRPAFSHFDSDSDGRIEFYGEYFEFPSRTFSDYREWDSNNDGNVTKPEFLASMRKEFKASFFEETPRPPTDVQEKKWALRFDLLDRVKDGAVTWKEVRALIDQYPFPVDGDGISYYTQYDENLDGVVSRDEFLSGARRMGDESFVLLRERVFTLLDLDSDGSISLSEHVRVGENAAYSFVSYDKDGDGVALFDELKGIGWVAGKSEERDRGHFDRMDANQDRRVTWEELRTVSHRTTAFGAIDHLTIDNSISRKEWAAVNREYLAAQKGEVLPGHPAWGYAVRWFPGIFDLIHFDDLDGNQDATISWKEFKSFRR